MTNSKRETTSRAIPRDVLLALVLTYLLPRMSFAEPKQPFVPGLYPVVGWTLGGSLGGLPRSGPELGLLYWPRWVFGYGINLGVLNHAEKEYFAGVAMGAVGFSAVWLEIAARSRQQKLSGFHITGAFWFLPMVYLSLGSDVQKHQPIVEAGVSFRLPSHFPFFKPDH